MSEEQTGIVVTGEGTAAAAVDSVVLTINLVDTRASAAEAFRAIGQTATRVLAALADDGVDARRVRTQDLTLGPRTRWQDEREIVLGYTATQRLIIRLPGLSGFERLLEDVALTGGDSLRIENVLLSPSDPAEAHREAREQAMADARVKAEQVAALAGRSLGEVRLVQEGAGRRPSSNDRSLPGAGGGRTGGHRGLVGQHGGDRALVLRRLTLPRLVISRQFRAPSTRADSRSAAVLVTPARDPASFAARCSPTVIGG